jgi:hypothetical protein
VTRDLYFPINGKLESAGDEIILTVRMPKGYLDAYISRKEGLLISAEELQELALQALKGTE